jgi:outer membrane protein OmpA-like peptidoglycan-associated protein
MLHAALFALALPVQAADIGGLDAHGFSVASHQGNPKGYLQLAYPFPGWEGAWDAGVTFDFSDDPLIENVGDQAVPVLDQVLAANVVGGASILGFARVDLAVPVFPYALDQIGSFAAMGDLRLDATVPILIPDELIPGIAIVPAVWAPTGAEARYLGDAGIGLGATLAVAQEIGPVGWVLNVGGRTGKRMEVRNVEWGTGLLAGFGMAYRVRDDASIAAELRATPTYGYSGEQFPLEALAHGRVRLPMGLYATLGGGRGLTKGVGSSNLRVVMGVGWSQPGIPPEEDLDGDGMGDRTDRCPQEPEDRDGFEDGDGCPDPDNDKDGVMDDVDRCVDDPEDLDGVRDEDGCPEYDADQDGISDGADQCPEEAEDLDGNQDGDGCPEEEMDRDGDGVPDWRDKCPDEPIRFGQNPETSDGCPKLAEISDDKIVITDKIYFELGKARLLPESTPVLEAVGQLLIENPEITDILIEGHTDDQGNDETNYRLSDQRAQAVMDWLIGYGIDRNRIASKGYGETRPIVPNSDDEARARNRRVEFTIVTRVKKD